MLARPTVFVIGAGAGVDLRMPVGEELSRTIADKTDIRYQNGWELTNGDADVDKALKEIAKANGGSANEWFAAGRTIRKGTFHTKSIDDFCHAQKGNDKVRDCAKLGIVKSILERERESYLFVENDYRRVFSNPDRVREAWISSFFRILFSQIVIGENLQDVFRNLSIISFNYDRCVEHYLYHALQDLSVDKQVAADLINDQLRILHPYGVIGRLPWQRNASKSEVPFGGGEYGHDYVGLAQQIKTYDERMEEEKTLEALREEVRQAQRLVFLGFHFHPQNMELLKCSDAGPECEVFGTTFGRSDSDVSIIVTRIVDCLKPKKSTGWTYLKRDKYDCRGLFTEFGTLLAG